LVVAILIRSQRPDTGRSIAQPRHAVAARRKRAARFAGGRETV
jgi:hypothetical protein